MLQVIRYPLSVLGICYVQRRACCLRASCTANHPPPKAIQCKMFFAVCRTTAIAILTVYYQLTPHSCSLHLLMVSSPTQLHFTTMNEQESLKTTFQNLLWPEVTTIPTVPSQRDFSSGGRENRDDPLIGTRESGQECTESTEEEDDVNVIGNSQVIQTVMVHDAGSTPQKRKVGRPKGLRDQKQARADLLDELIAMREKLGWKGVSIDSKRSYENSQKHE